jgi:hypothetical protein
MVVAEHRSGQCGRVAQVAAARAQVVPGCERGVVDVVRAGHAVAVAIHRVARPAGRNELHRTDSAVPRGVAVQPPTVGVPDGRHAGAAGQLRTQDRADRRAVGVDCAAAGVAGLDPTDRGQQRPGQPATRPGTGEGALGPQVGVQHGARDAERSRRHAGQRPGAGDGDHTGGSGGGGAGQQVS